MPPSIVIRAIDVNRFRREPEGDVHRAGGENAFPRRRTRHGLPEPQALNEGSQSRCGWSNQIHLTLPLITANLPKQSALPSELRIRRYEVGFDASRRHTLGNDLPLRQAAKYAGQVALLLRLLPFIAAEPVFALEGGTAINLLDRDMPRLSVDIDLAYLPVNDRAKSLLKLWPASRSAAYDPK